ncbi:hypothetical protein GGX14DRAFT_658715 [Mycena pura]|uniref:Uncharacterized protein n=1 Tax=Mycena pura TaxID=153505 RepID=A0AAD6YBL3_9AGAR|nr:hypothetical protein GGX14DRAFT_658715 [Mycena pura]
MDFGLEGLEKSRPPPAACIVQHVHPRSPPTDTSCKTLHTALPVTHAECCTPHEAARCRCTLSAARRHLRLLFAPVPTAHPCVEKHPHIALPPPFFPMAMMLSSLVALDLRLPLPGPNATAEEHIGHALFAASAQRPPPAARARVAQDLLCTPTSPQVVRCPPLTLAKHIAKGEIRICNLVATKSHSQFELALNRMRESLLRYSHDQPAVFYTDNMADKPFLEHCFPSLLDAVVAVEKYPHLDALEIPLNVKTQVLDTVSTIDAVMGSILFDLPADDSKEKLVVFVDSERNVETSAQGYVTGRGQTANSQLAYKDHIYILQIGKMLSGGSLPKALIKLLSNPHILKVGRSVNADLIDLAKLAKDRLLVSSAKIGLADLAWDREQLTESQTKYAALDVYACLCIYDAIITIPIPTPLPKNPIIGTRVLVFNADQGRVLTHGKITALDGTYDKINITNTRCLVEVTEVFVPAAIITTHPPKSFIDVRPCAIQYCLLTDSCPPRHNISVSHICYPTAPQPTSGFQFL